VPRAARAGLRGAVEEHAAHGHRGHVPASRVPASGEEHVPLVLASGGSGKLVTFVLPHPRARDARERKIEFF